MEAAAVAKGRDHSNVPVMVEEGKRKRMKKKQQEADRLVNVVVVVVVIVVAAISFETDRGGSQNSARDAENRIEKSSFRTESTTHRYPLSHHHHHLFSPPRFNFHSSN